MPSSDTARHALATQLNDYLPAGTEQLCADWLWQDTIQLRISRPRKTKLGDFRPAHNGRPHRISVNGDLDPLQFLITFTHEVAHVHTWNRYGPQAAPHGKQWKACYQRLLHLILALEVLSPDTSRQLYLHSRNPKASSGLDQHLNQLKKPASGLILNQLQPGKTFTTESGRVFQTVRKLRTYWLCREPESERYFRVLGTIAVTPVPEC